MFKIESGIFLLCVIILLFPALYNGFPIVTSDTGSYIEDAFKLYVPSDRSIGYGIFIRLTSLTFSLWYVLFAQAIVLTFFLRLLVRHFCKNVNYNYLLPAVVLLITVCTSAAWFCSQIMADIFTAILLLAICVLYFVPISRKWQTYLLLFFIWFFIILHNSHLLIVLILSLLLAAFYTYKRNKVFLRKSLMLFSMSVMGFLFLSTLNFISGKGFTIAWAWL